MRWYEHVLRREDEHVLRKAFEFEVNGKMKRGRPGKTWKMQVEKESKSVASLEKRDAMNRVRWRVRVGEIAVRVGWIWPPLFTGINPDQNWVMMKYGYRQKLGCIKNSTVISMND